MNRSLAVCLALALAPAPVLAQTAPPPPPAITGAVAPNAQQRAAMQQMDAQMQQLHAQLRARMLASLTPAHRTMLATLVGQLALSAEPNLEAAAQQLDAALTMPEKQSIVATDTAARTSIRSLMEQHRAAFEASLPADQQAKIAQHEAQMKAFMQSHPRPARVPDPGAIVLRTLGSIGGPGRFGGARISSGMLHDQVFQR